MVYAAGAAGKHVMTSSSSPGVCLKQEGLAYIAGAEVPCVFADVVRGGPGLGTIQPSQADYFQNTKGGGNGDYRNIVLAPASVQEMADFVPLGFDLLRRCHRPDDGKGRPARAEGPPHRRGNQSQVSLGSHRPQAWHATPRHHLLGPRLGPHGRAQPSPPTQIRRSDQERSPLRNDRLRRCRIRIRRLRLQRPYRPEVGATRSRRRSESRSAPSYHLVALPDPSHP